MRNRIFTAVLLSVLTLLPATAARHARQAVRPQASAARMSHTDSLRYDYFFLEAVCQDARENYAAAYDLVRHCLAINPQAADAHYLMAMYCSYMQQDSLALAHLEEAARISPHNETYLERVAQYYYNTKASDQAIEAYERLAATNPDRTDIQNILIALYQKRKDYDSMLRCIGRIERVDGNSEELTLSKVRVYELKEDKKRAYRALAQLAEEHPSDLGYRMMMGNWLMQNGRQGEAYKIYTAAEQEDSTSSHVLSSLYDYYKATGDEARATEYMNRILLNPKTEDKSKVTMMKQVIADNERQGGDSTQVLALFDRILGINPTDITMGELRIAYMSLKSMPQDTMYHAMQTLLAVAPDKADTRGMMLQTLLAGQRWKEVITLAEEGTMYNPDELIFYYFLGLAHYQEKDNPAALRAFARAMAVVGDDSDKDLVSDIYSMMGSIYSEEGQQEECYDAFEKSLQWKSDNTETLNNYAYFLSLEGKDLERAAAMSYKTVKAEPQSATFLDTYAWILFMQQRYAEAALYIEQAIQNDTDSIQSSVIMEHAGDIYAMKGDVGKALYYWRKALEAGSESATLPKKIAMKQYIKE